MAPISPSRAAAFRILLEVEQGHAHSDDLLRARFVSRLSPIDRNLTTALTLGVLRWQIRLDHEIKQFLAKPNTKLDPEIRIALRLGAFQILHMERIPARAAIAESVELAKTSGHSFGARMVNAVLRKLAYLQAARAGRAKSDTHSEIPLAETSPTSGHDFSRAEEPTKDEGALAPAALALAFAHPAWLVGRWAARYGIEAARTICTHGQSQPALNLRLADSAVETELASESIELAPGSLLALSRTLVSGDIASSRAFRTGSVRIQDEGSQLVAELASSHTALNQDQKKICDACAAPGGKTLILAERFPHSHIVACEASETRCAELAQRLAPLGNRIECRNIDTATLSADETFDLVLVDAPCSGTGTLGRNPEIRHRLRAEDLTRQSERQRAILSAALRAVRPGGRVVYSTCSLEPEENDDVVAAALAANPSARQLSLAPAIAALDAHLLLTDGAATSLQAALAPSGALRLIPGAHSTDGFFVALLERID
ncbi:MAG: transcription antitermination factor NusB [Terracidiphilus sp.]|nr:transcription antitermination factor NusB [Terracidiphilus sp.]